MKTKLLCLTIDEQMLIALKKYSNSDKVKPQRIIRRIIAKFISSNEKINYLVDEENEKSNRVQLSLTNSEMAKMKTISNQYGIKPQDFFRTCLSNYPNVQDVPFLEENSNQLKEYLMQINRIHNNINQVAKHLNIRDKTGELTNADINEAAKILNTKIDELKPLLYEGLKTIKTISNINKTHWKKIVKET